MTSIEIPTPVPCALGVNIDHVATLRNVRGTAYPDPIQAALEAEAAGADVITLHLREDRRHIRDADVYALRTQLRTRMNLECALTPEMLTIACQVRPHDICLVPEKRQELTTEGGLDAAAQLETVKKACARLADAGVRVSLFIDPDEAQIRAAHTAGAPVIELHTGGYASAGCEETRQYAFTRIVRGLELGRALGLRVNAGHGLHYSNVQPIAALKTKGLSELNIGHAIVARALFAGWQPAIREMKALLARAIRASHASAQ